jgi:small subunit ribosomal protein S6
LLRDYEILYIVRPELDEEQLGKAVGSVETLISNLGGEPQKTDVWGRRRLAYEVAHLREGQYVLTDFRLEPERVKEMEATLKISETIFRHLITRKPEKSKRRAAAAPATPAPAPALEDVAAVAPAEDVAAPEEEESEA